MSTARLNLLVLKTRQMEKLKTFYAALGSAFTEEKHGGGPTHYAARLGEVVLELYPLSGAIGRPDAALRLGFTVPDVDAAVRALEAAGGTTVDKPRRTEWGYRAVVCDPDGRAVELCQA